LEGLFFAFVAIFGSVIVSVESDTKVTPSFFGDDLPGLPLFKYSCSILDVGELVIIRLSFESRLLGLSIDVG